MQFRGLFALSAALLSVAGCLNQRPASFPGVADEALILAQKERVFENGILYKPDSTPDDSLAARLAPLLLQESATSGRAAEPVPLTVQATAREATVGQGRFVQLTYLWPRVRVGAPPALQRMEGFRMTLNASGAPVIWECLPRPDGTRVLFAARSLEEAARRQHGPPLPGRRFALETAIENDRSTVLAGLVDDGPMPMGPIVYLDSSTASITTVLCRCSTAQVQEVSQTSVYDLRPATGVFPAEILQSASLTEPQLHWLLGQADELPSALRLPDRF